MLNFFYKTWIIKAVQIKNRENESQDNKEILISGNSNNLGDIYISFLLMQLTSNTNIQIYNKNKRHVISYRQELLH